MAIPYLASIDLNKNELQNARIQNLASAPTQAAGLIYFDTGTGLLGISNGTAWTYLAAGLDAATVRQTIATALSGSTVITSTYSSSPGTFVLTIGAGQIVDSMVSGSAAISADKIAAGSTNGVYTLTEKTKLSGIATGATANSTDAYLLSRANHTGTQTTSTISDFTTAVNSAIAAVVNAAPSSLDTLKELADALGDDPNFAATMTTQLGLKANTSSLATVATSGTYASLTSKPSYSVTVGDGSATSYTITHSLGTRNVQVTLFTTATPYTQVVTQVAFTSTTTVTLTFGTAPTSGQYTVYITAV